MRNYPPDYNAPHHRVARARATTEHYAPMLTRYKLTSPWAPAAIGHYGELLGHALGHALAALGDRDGYAPDPIRSAATELLRYGDDGVSIQAIFDYAGARQASGQG